MTPPSYYRRRPGGFYEPTVNVQGVWNEAEQHMAPVSGLLVHAIEEHEPREDLQLARITFEILGVVPAALTEITVTTIRPGRTIELVEAVLVAGGRPAVRAHAWRMSRQSTAEIAGGAPEALPAPETMADWKGTVTWPGGYIRTLDGRQAEGSSPGRGQVWLRTDVCLVEDVEASPTAAFIGLVDTANGVLVREDPKEWVFPNIDLSIHLWRRPVAGWVGFDTTVVFGGDGIGLTSTILHDIEGPVGRSEQILTIRRRT
ncbi:MAG: thioesterase family protein [Lapillicoccus sp.]